MASPFERKTASTSNRARQPGGGPSTRAVHGGENRPLPHHSLTHPIVQTATYTFDDSADLRSFMEARMWGLHEGRVDYGRYGNPTVEAVEAKIAQREGGEAAVLFSSGMAAITTSLLSLLSAGQHLIVTEEAYRRTREFCLSFLRRYGIECSVVPASDVAAVEAAMQPNTKVLFTESPTNPYLRIVDLPSLVKVASRNGVTTMVDSTLATPVNQRPLEFGVDLVVHSATKYLGGHNDLLAGVVVGSPSLVALVRQNLWVCGAISDPQTAYLLHRGLKTLALRVRQQNETAQRVAGFLEAHPRVRRVWYPGLPSHPDHHVARGQMSGFGGVVSLELEADLDGTSRFVDALEIPIIAPSFGGLESFIEQPALMSYFELSTEERLAVGIQDSLVRLSCGVEDPQDLIEDLARALERF